MIYINYLRYIFQYIPILFLKNINLNCITTVTAILPSSNIYFIMFVLKYSYFFKKFSLIDLGGYDIPAVYSRVSGVLNLNIIYTPVLWYLLKDLRGNQIFFFSLNATQNSLFKSIELLYRNARWLEREVSEFFGFFFESKVDRRVLFTIPLFYNSPFRRKYPTIGFYEIFFCPILKKLKFKHLSLQI